MVEAKFYCPTCGKTFPGSEVSKGIGALVNEPRHPYICPSCGGKLEYAIWRAMVENYHKHYTSFSSLEGAALELKELILNNPGHDSSVLYTLAELLDVALGNVYGENAVSVYPYNQSGDDCSDDDLDARIEVERDGCRFTVTLCSFGGCPLCREDFEELLEDLDSFLRESIEAKKTFMAAWRP